MFDIGIGEIIALAIVGLLIFGPDRLPKAAADAGRWARQIRAMAANAKTDLADSAGVDLSDTVGAVKELRDLHPKRWASGLFDDEPSKSNGAQRKSGTTPSGSVGPAPFDPDLT